MGLAQGGPPPTEIRREGLAGDDREDGQILDDAATAGCTGPSLVFRRPREWTRHGHHSIGGARTHGSGFRPQKTLPSTRCAIRLLSAGGHLFLPAHPRESADSPRALGSLVGDRR